MRGEIGHVRHNFLRWRRCGGWSAEYAVLPKMKVSEDGSRRVTMMFS